MTPEERRSQLAIGSAKHIVEVIRAYETAGVEEVIFKGMPNAPRLYRRLSEEVLPAFS